MLHHGTHLLLHYGTLLLLHYGKQFLLQLSETVVPVSRQAIDDNIRTTLEQLQQQVADNQEKYKQACVDQITEKEKEIVKAISIMSITENGHSNKGSSEAEQGQFSRPCL